jgi:hypothetical protein
MKGWKYVGRHKVVILAKKDGRAIIASSICA